jgi:hypothetical protein
MSYRVCYEYAENHMPTTRLTPEIISAAIEGFEAQKARINQHIADLRAMLSGGPAKTAATPEASPGKRIISAAARRRMALGQKRRWAAIKGTSEPLPQATPEPPKPKRKLSAAGRAAIVAALKKRWAAKKAAAHPAPAKKAVTKKTTAKKAAVKAPPAKAAKKAAPVKKRAAKKAVAKKAAPAAAQAPAPVGV